MDNAQAVDWLSHRLASTIERVRRSVTGDRQLRVRFVVEEAPVQAPPEVQPRAPSAAPGPAAPRRPRRAPEAGEPAGVEALRA